MKIRSDDSLAICVSFISMKTTVNSSIRSGNVFAPLHHVILHMLSILYAPFPFSANYALDHIFFFFALILHVLSILYVPFLQIMLFFFAGET